MLRAVILGAVLGPLAFGIPVSAGPPRDVEGHPEAVSGTPDRSRRCVVAVAAGEGVGGRRLCTAARCCCERLSGSPDDAAAHWHLGEVRVGDEWVPGRPRRRSRQPLARALSVPDERSKKGSTVADQLFWRTGPALTCCLMRSEHYSRVRRDRSVPSRRPTSGSETYFVNSQWISCRIRRALDERAVRWNRTLATYGPRRGATRPGVARSRQRRSLRRLPIPLRTGAIRSGCSRWSRRSATRAMWSIGRI